MTLQVFGVDPSLTGTGIVHATSQTVEAWKPSVPKIVGRGTLHLSRLHGIVQSTVSSMEQRVGSLDACLCVIEAPYISHRTVGITRLIGLHYLLRDALRLEGAGVIDVAPSVVKQIATGNGNANKDQMVAAAQALLGYQGDDHDEADAMWLCQIGIQLVGDHPQAIVLPDGRADLISQIYDTNSIEDAA